MGEKTDEESRGGLGMNQFWMGMAAIWFLGTLLSLAMDSQNPLAGTTLSASLSETATTITVVDTAGFPSTGSRGFVGQEEFSWTGTTSTTFTGVTRGINNTKAQEHASGQKVLSQIGGLINLGLDFTQIQHSESNLGIPVLGNIADGAKTVWVGSGMFLRFAAKMIAADYGWADGNMIFVRYAMMGIFGSALVFALFRALRGIL